jgi:hypothetical protein
MDKHSTALNALRTRDTTKTIMQQINSERVFLGGMLLEKVGMRKLNPEDKQIQDVIVYLKSKISECDLKLKEQMNMHFKAMEYLEDYNDEFNTSKKWKQWMEYRNKIRYIQD